MEIGLGLPMRAMDAEEIVRWAQLADRGPFSSLNAGERLTFESNDPMISLSFAAAVTRRIRLQTSVLCLPLHNAGVVAKQAATLERSSGGRFSLGVGIGARPLDYAVAPAEWAGRAKRFEEQMEFMQRVWAGVEPVADTAPVGPPTRRLGGPELIIGAFARPALERAGRVADGLRSFDFAPDPAIHRARYDIVLKAWHDAGRDGAPRLIAATHFALGDDSVQAYEQHVHQYYGYSESAVAGALGANALTNDRALSEFIRRCADEGIDELVFTAPTTEPPSSIERLAEVVAAT